MLNILRKRLAKPQAEQSTSEPAQTEGETPRVVVYSTTWCGSCRMAKRYLNQQGVPFVEIDIERVEGAAEQVMRWARGNKTVPTIKIDDIIVVDWDRRAVERALMEAGLTRRPV